MISSTCIEIPLSRGKVALIDAEDYELVKDFNWFLSGVRTQYASRHLSPRVRGGGNRLLAMHRLLLNAAPGEVVDHINGDSLDNRRSNLRLCTNRDNARNRGACKNNTSGYKGVSWCLAANKWIANVSADAGRVYLGVFDCKHDAAEAYNAAALIHHGDFAKLNIIDRNT